MNTRSHTKVSLCSDSEHAEQVDSSEDFLCLKQQSTDHVKSGTMFTPGVCAPSENLRGSELSLSSVSTAWERLRQASVSEGGSACLAGNILPRASEGTAPAGEAPGYAPGASGSSENLSHWRAHFRPLWNRTGLPREIHAKTWAPHFTTETAAKKRVPVAGGILCAVLEQPGKGLFFQLK